MEEWLHVSTEVIGAPMREWPGPGSERPKKFAEHADPEKGEDGGDQRSPPNRPPRSGEFEIGLVKRID